MDNTGDRNPIRGSSRGRNRVLLGIGLAVVLLISTVAVCLHTRDSRIRNIMQERFEALPRHESFESEWLHIKTGVVRPADYYFDYVMPWEPDATRLWLQFESSEAIETLCDEYPALFEADMALIVWGYERLSETPNSCAFEAAYDGFAVDVRLRRKPYGTEIVVQGQCLETWSNVQDGCRA